MMDSIVGCGFEFRLFPLTAEPSSHTSTTTYLKADTHGSLYFSAFKQRPNQENHKF